MAVNADSNVNSLVMHPNPASVRTGLDARLGYRRGDFAPGRDAPRERNDVDMPD